MSLKIQIKVLFSQPIVEGKQQINPLKAQHTSFENFTKNDWYRGSMRDDRPYKALNFLKLFNNITYNN